MKMYSTTKGTPFPKCLSPLEQPHQRGDHRSQRGMHKKHPTAKRYVAPCGLLASRVRHTIIAFSFSCTKVPYGSRFRALGQRMGFFPVYAVRSDPKHASAISVALYTWVSDGPFSRGRCHRSRFDVRVLCWPFSGDTGRRNLLSPVVTAFQRAPRTIPPGCFPWRNPSAVLNP